MLALWSMFNGRHTMKRGWLPPSEARALYAGSPLKSAKRRRKTIAFFGA